MKRLFTFFLTLLVAFSAGSCSDKEATPPDYEIAEGLQLIANKSLSGGLVYIGHETTLFTFYSDIFPFEVYDGATITIYPLSDSMPLFEYRDSENDCIKAVRTISTEELIFFPSFLTPEVGLPGCSRDGYRFDVSLFVPKKPGNYDFYFTIDNNRKNLHYRTHTFRLELGVYDETNPDLFTINTRMLD